MAKKSNSEKFGDFELSISPDNIAELVLDRKDSSTNTLNAQILSDLSIAIDSVKNKKVEALVISSAKENGFIAGADINEFVGVSDVEQATKMVLECQSVFDKLADLECATIAKIHGFCLGGGMELALACKYRIALDSPKTKLGLPEVLLGLQPGWGGTVRLPRVTGTLRAFDIMLSGRLLSASVAKKLGAVDACVPLRCFDDAVQHYATKKPPVRKVGIFDKIINMNFIRPFVAKFLASQVAKKAKLEHYPAPFAMIENWTNHSIFSPRAIPEEASSISRLLVTPTAQNLIRLFFLREKLKKITSKDTPNVNHIHVVGAGVMGGDIAAWCALRGFKVTLEDKYLPAISASLTRARKLYKKKLKKDHLVQAACDRLQADIKGFGAKSADIIIEAIIEDVAAKQKLFERLEKVSKKGAVLATNTSTIPLETISKSLEDKSRLVGIHFFNPVSQMQLVEIVEYKHTSREIFDIATKFVTKLDKLALPVKSSPGFLVNRILVPYVMESIMLYLEGIPGPVIDKAATDFGMMMGPIELADVVGLDVCVAAAKSLGVNIPEAITRMVADGKLGKKTNEGFYKYKKGKPIKNKSELEGSHPTDIQQRLIMRLLNESKACLREKIVENQDLLDAGMIFGAGFAPFRGGPMRYLSTLELPKVIEELSALEKKYGERFKADKSWAA